MNSKIKQKLLIEFEKFKGQYVISLSHEDRVVRYIGLGDDGDDFYYIFYNGNELLLSSVLFGFVPLKNYIPNIDYERFIRLGKLNDKITDEVDNVYNRGATLTFIGDRTNDLRNHLIESHKDELLTDICWDYN